MAVSLWTTRTKSVNDQSGEEDLQCGRRTSLVRLSAGYLFVYASYSCKRDTHSGFGAASFIFDSSIGEKGGKPGGDRFQPAGSLVFRGVLHNASLIAISTIRSERPFFIMTVQKVRFWCTFIGGKSTER